MIEQILNWLSFSLEARFFLRAREAVNAYTRVNDLPAVAPVALNCWNEYFEAENEGRKAVMKCIIGGEVMTKEDFEVITRATIWYCSKETNWNEQNKKGVQNV